MERMSEIVILIYFFLIEALRCSGNQKTKLAQQIPFLWGLYFGLLQQAQQSITVKTHPITFFSQTVGR